MLGIRTRDLAQTNPLSYCGPYYSFVRLPHTSFSLPCDHPCTLYLAAISLCPSLRLPLILSLSFFLTLLFVHFLPLFWARKDFRTKEIFSEKHWCSLNHPYLKYHKKTHFGWLTFASFFKIDLYHLGSNVEFKISIQPWLANLVNRCQQL